MTNMDFSCSAEILAVAIFTVHASYWFFVSLDLLYVVIGIIVAVILFLLIIIFVIIIIIRNTLVKKSRGKFSEYLSTVFLDICNLST